jgi:hypothetical protein
MLFENKSQVCEDTSERTIWQEEVLERISKRLNEERET